MGAKELKAWILDKGLCSGCGGCVGLCPYIKARQDRVAMIEPCTLEEGRCHKICPWVDFDHENLVREYFPAAGENKEIGPFNAVYLARSADEELRACGQYGGTVSALAQAAIDSGLVNGLVGVRAADSPEGLPPGEPAWLCDRQSVVDAAGSKFQQVPSLALFNKKIESADVKSIGFIGRPCQITALRRRMRLLEPVMEKLQVSIGVFCMWALDYRKLAKLVDQQAGPGPVECFDVPKGRCVITRAGEPIEIDYEKARSQAKKSCRYCYDFTSELADISVGATEFDDAYNTLIVRNAAGRALVEKAVEIGLLEISPFPDDKLELLKQASVGKKKRVIDACGDLPPETALEISECERNFILGETDQ